MKHEIFSLDISEKENKVKITGEYKTKCVFKKIIKLPILAIIRIVNYISNRSKRTKGSN